MGNFFSRDFKRKWANGLYSKRFRTWFIAKTDDCASSYQVSVHSPKSDKGILWSSFGYDWGILKPLLSEYKSFTIFVLNHHLESTYEYSIMDLQVL